MPPLSRRRALRTTGTAALIGLAGCASGGSTEPTYRLSAEHVGDSLADAFRWRARGQFAAADRGLMDRLIGEGSLTTEGFALYPVGSNDRRYVERDGTYYGISIERTEEVERERWILWFDLIDGEPPADAEVFTSSLGVGSQTDLATEYGLSKRDVRVVEDAAGEIPTEFEFRDLEDAPPERRGHTFVRRTADQTDLVPDPPFTHVAFETSDEPRYARAVAERSPVALQQYEHAAEAVAESAANYAEHVRERYLEATFDRTTLSDERRTLLDDVTSSVPPAERRREQGDDGGRAVEPDAGHEERPPLSAAMEAIIDRLGLGGVQTPEPGGVTFSDEPYFGYKGTNFRAQLEILR